MLNWSNIEFSNRVGRAEFFFLVHVFDLHINVSMERYHRVKETTSNINTSILYQCRLFLLYVIDIPVSVLRSS